MRVLILTAAALTLAACSTTYTKPGGTQAALDRDRAACQYKLQTVGDGVAWPHLVRGCLIHEKGWTAS